MIDLLNFLITQIVDEPEAVTVRESAGQNNTVILTVAVAENDMGKIIGRGGKIIAAIRELIKVKAVKSNRRVRVVLAEPATQTD